MAYVNDNREILYQNLLDASCSEQLTAECMQLADAGLQARMLQKLQGQRKYLLDAIHQKENALRCLDYLLARIQKEQ